MRSTAGGTPHVDRSTALDRIKSIAHTGFGVSKVVAGQVGRAAVGVSKAAGAVTHEVVERRRSARRPAGSGGSAPPAPVVVPEPPVAEPAPDTAAAITSDVDAEPEEHGPSPADLARVVAKKPRQTRPATPPRKRPAKKSVPGAKLPPRRPE
jgi:hypothetical protein